MGIQILQINQVFYLLVQYKAIRESLLSIDQLFIHILEYSVKYCNLPYIAVKMRVLTLPKKGI